MTRKALAILILIGLASVGVSQLYGSIYYVSPNGDNSNPGTHDHPWATPGYGSRQLQPGDTLIILGGRYVLSRYPDDIIAPTSGRSDAWITIIGEEENTPILAGRGNLLTAIDLSGCSYVRIENIEITSDGGALFRDGLEILGSPASHIVLKNLHIHHIDEFGMNIQDVEDLLVENCRVHHCGFGGLGGPRGSQGGWRDVVIRGCHLSYSGHYYQGVEDNPNNPYDRPDGFGIEPSDGPVEIADCIVEHNKGDGLDSKAQNTYIHNCIVANNSCDGIKLWGDNSKIENCLIYGTGDGVGGASPWAGIVIDQIEQLNAHFEIVNTTVHDNPTREAYSMYVQYPDPLYPSTANPITLVMRNTIIAGGGGIVYISDVVNFTAEHCIFYRPGQDVQVYANGRDYTAAQIEAGELGEGNLSRDPLFVSPAWGTEGDYHLQQGSPAIDAGMSGTGIPLVDLEYMPRSQGSAPDIGAYEYKSAPISDLEITKTDSPDPVTIGEQVTYTLTVVNHGPDPVEYADVGDELPFQASFVSATPSVGNASYDQQSHSVNWHIPGLDTNQQATLTITVQAPYDIAYDRIVNTATVTCATTSLDPNDQNNMVTEETRLKWEEDGDGVADSEEQGPQGNDPNYDGNNDGIPDWQQGNVTSIHTFDGSYYVTLACSGGSLRDVRTMDNPHPQDAPQDANFPWGFFSFQIELDPGVTEAAVTLYLPQGSDPVSYYKYGPTSDDPNEHWYEFLFDGQTGAEMNGNVITLHLVDGGRGDDDLAQNGVIIDQNAPAVSPTSLQVRNIRTDETFDTISEAVNQALEGDTLVIEGQGVLLDNIAIDKSLTIRAASDANVTIRAEDPSKSVFSIAADGVVIQSLEITGSTGTSVAGVTLVRSHNCIISDNTITGNDIGIDLELSGGNTISNNEIRGNGQGIYLYGSNGNLITRNTISDNRAAGISFAPTGGGTDNRISRNLLEGNQVGLELPSGSNLIFLNIVRGNHTGVSTGSRPQGNFIFLNDFLQNTNNALSDAGGSPETQWHTLVEVDYRYNGQQFHGYLGNYWDDYLEHHPAVPPQGLDADHNGIWDQPYQTSQYDNDDPYPLVDRVESYGFDENGLIPLLAVWPERIDFHTVIRGESSTCRVAIRNLSGLRVQISDIRLEGDNADQFSIKSGSGSGYLSPYGSREVVLAFSPTSLGLKKKTRLIISTGAFNDSFEIPVEGICGLVGLPRTGQTECYDPYGDLIDRYDRWAEGLDGQVRAGVPWPLDARERFIDNGDGTVTDKLTGLMWLKCANPIKEFHPEFDAPPEQDDPNENGDPGDGLVSRRYAGMFIQRMNDGTYADCNAGYTDWRLPNINELESLLNYGEQSYLWLGSARSGNEKVFDDTGPYYYWSSTRGTVVQLETDEETPTFNFVACVWPVRGPEQLPSNGPPIIQLPKPSGSMIDDQGMEWPIHRFTTYQDVIVDNLTGLMWTRNADLANGRVRWSEALNLVSNLDVEGYTDWRLPNVKELRSLIDYWETHPDQYLYSQGFDNLLDNNQGSIYSYWTSTTESGGSKTKAFIVGLGDGHVSLASKDDLFKVIAVRGGVIRPYEEWGPEGVQENYDGNSDGVPDGEQPNVESLHTYNGRGYVTIASPQGTILEDVYHVDPNDLPQSPPQGLDLQWGLFSFRIENIPPGGSVTVTVYLPSGSAPNTYYKYGPEPTNASPHWYEFLFDGQTGAEINGNVITLHLVDGERGDDDLTSNGRIVDANGPGISTAPNILVSSSTLNFGSVLPGDTKELSLTVSNGGQGDLNIGSISVTGPDASEFRILQDNCLNRAIQPGESCQVRIEFRPQSPGVKEAVLEIRSNDPDTPLLRAKLKGGRSTLGDVSGDGRITAYDAAEILRYLVGKEELSETQLKAADVTGNGEVSALDAARILQFVVGLIGEFASGEGAPSLKAESRTISLTSLRARPGERITIPILVDDPKGIISGEITIRFDGKALKFIGARSNFSLESRVEGDMLKLAFAGIRSGESRELVYLEFEVMDDTSEYARLKLERGKLNENVDVKLENGMVELIPARTELLQNYPNPFNPETWIPFRLADDADVIIKIYDMTGKLVRKFDLGHVDSGNYISRSRAVYWDGRNKQGERVASGVYIYQLQVDGKAFVRKMVILR